MMEVGCECSGPMKSLLTGGLQQTIYHAMAKKAEQFSSDQTRWKAAVQEFRLPYWDWLRPRAKQVGHTVIGIGKDGKPQSPFDYLFDLPRILKEKQVTVYLPSRRAPDEEKKLKSIPNPLYSFSFENSKTKIPDEQWDTRNPAMSRAKTIRQPTINIQESDMLQVDDILNKQREANVIFLLDLFVRQTYSDYLRMSNHSDTKGGGSGSIESLHDNYHDYLGGNAHMGDPTVAAFDPVFWFHHCNIDRIMAIWQATHPKRWFPAKTREQKGPDDPLYPFRALKNGKLDWWTSNDSIDTKTFGYTYPDLDPVGAEAIFNEFGRKYVWSIHEESRPDGFGDTPPEDMEPIVVNDSPFFKYQVSTKPAFPGGFELASQVKMEPIKARRNVFFKIANSSEDATDGQGEVSVMAVSSAGAAAEVQPSEGEADVAVAPEQAQSMPEKVQPSTEQVHPTPEVSVTTTEQPEGTKAVRNWYVDSLVPKNAFNGSFTLFYFVSGADNIRKPYTQEPSLAALNHIFAAPIEACGNCAQQAEAGAIISDTEPITPILLDIVKNTPFLESIEPEHVVPFLLNNFQVRVLGVSACGDVDQGVQLTLMQPNSEDVEPYNVKDLKLSISTTVQYYRPGSLMATDGPKARFPEVTDKILAAPAAAVESTT